MNTLVFTRNGEKFVEHQEWDEFSPMVTDKFQKIKEDEGILLVINMNIIIYFNLKHTRSLSYLLPLTRSIGLPPHASVAQKNADQRYSSLIRTKISTFLYKLM